MPLPPPKVKKRVERPKVRTEDTLGLVAAETRNLPHPDKRLQEIPRIAETAHIPPMLARRIRNVTAELASRQMEALSLYEPLPMQQRFHESQAKIRMNRGSNRAGKSQASGAEIGWALTGTHPYIDYPKENGIAYCVGWDHRHVGQVMWKMVGRPGAFKIIRDEFTKKWRSVRPWQAYDEAYKETWRDAPPFIPGRLIKDVSWESKKDETPKKLKMRNGWECNFASSKGAPQQGIKLNIGWIDEEIENPKWYDEMISRVGAVTPRMFWSATPLAATEQLYELHQKAHDPNADGTVKEFLLTLDDNPYIPQKVKDEFKAALSPDELRVRYYGEFALSGFRRYPGYSIQEHCIKPIEIPPGWTRYMVVDPGVQICAVLFAAVPPSTVGGMPRKYELHIYDELYLKNCTSMKFGEEVAKKMGHMRTGFEAFIIDGQFGRQTEVSGDSIEDQYAYELQARGVKSRTTGHGFIRGSSDLEGREGMVKRLMQIRPSTGDAALRIHRDNCSNLDWEIKNQFYKRTAQGRITDKRKPGQDHAVDCLEYLAAYEPQWVPRKQKSHSTSDWVFRLLKNKKNKEKQNHDGTISLGPPGAA